MGKSLISNPPYNLKWVIPPFGQMQPRFLEYTIPPKNNANFAFVLTALDSIDDKAAFLLPNSVLKSSVKEEEEIREQLIKKNVLEAVITLPDSMFESTNISTCILLFNKHKKTQTIEMIDMRQTYIEEQRDQKGQFGGSSHTNRTYHKTVKVLTDEGMSKAIDAIAERRNEKEFCKAVYPEQLKESGYCLSPLRYIEFIEREVKHRSYEDIAADLNRIINQKNSIKLTINESLAKSLGLYEIFLQMKNEIDLTESFAIVGEKVEKEQFITISKNAAEFKIENKCRDKLPEIFMLFLQMWKQRIMYLNNEENRLLAEFRDAILPELMSGKYSQALEENGGF